MAASMTGFGRSRAEGQGMEFTIEIKTLNHRFLDVNTRLPRLLSFLEEDIRSLTQGILDRGRVEIHIVPSSTVGNRVEVQLNKPLAESYISCFRTLSHDYGVKSDIPLSALVDIQDMFLVSEKQQDETLIKEMVLKALGEALGKVKEMRLREGQKL